MYYYILKPQSWLNAFQRIKVNLCISWLVAVHITYGLPLCSR